MIEFFRHKSNLTSETDQVKKDGRYYPLSDMLTLEEAQRILRILLEDRKAREVVMKMKSTGVLGAIAIVRRFKACNWDRLDRIPDISDSGELHYEYVDCGYKGANRRCPFSNPLDTKPFCIIKNQFNIPNHEIGTNPGDHCRRAG